MYIALLNGELPLYNRYFSNCVGLIYLAIELPSIITAFVHHPSPVAVEFVYSETRACS